MLYHLRHQGSHIRDKRQAQKQSLIFPSKLAPTFLFTPSHFSYGSTILLRLKPSCYNEFSFCHTHLRNPVDSVFQIASENDHFSPPPPLPLWFIIPSSLKNHCQSSQVVSLCMLLSLLTQFIFHMSAASQSYPFMDVESYHISDKNILLYSE